MPALTVAYFALELCGVELGQQLPFADRLALVDQQAFDASLDVLRRERDLAALRCVRWRSRPEASAGRICVAIRG